MARWQKLAHKVNRPPRGAWAAVFSNLVERLGVFMGHTVGLKTIWRQDGRWFVSKSSLKTSRPHSL